MIKHLHLFLMSVLIFSGKAQADTAIQRDTLQIPAAHPADPVGTKMNVFPNPSAGDVHLQLAKAPATPLLIQIFSSNGALVHTEVMKDKELALDLGTQPKGVYYIRSTEKEKAIPLVIQ
ncbi:MAG: T9SS type A sorting domain-containing protein [Chitinophaga sp.]|uniref:T9SS type A sorting domain-containing protein n=1 Tax=Chitinophaga sp. TaxID=1869181 RepID=UPI001B2F2275|nr:T9SS type A sorting domain-containing protein [Chitinophaga sp.]MBO9733136.1 T9SS type A sorting domain-containing protein [Chitinophaga sp.]